MIEVEEERYFTLSALDVNCSGSKRSLAKACEMNKASDLVKKGKEYSSHQEYLKLKARVEALQRSQRNLLGEDLGPLSGKELESLERQLDMSLKQIRSTRTQCMLDQLSDLQRREQMLSEANKTLRRRLEEGTQANPHQWDPSVQMAFVRSQAQAQAQGEGYFHPPIDCEPTLQIGSYQTEQITVATAGPSSMNTFMGAWLA
ncbi:hypothetical protein Scep_018212 [Stephania cephalantha]|uniref:K-box domain-containing protein n=1 Tax=Stephania cephalantha TaxID=152367 RepID=A0AAP0IQY8_9MAGN